MLRHSLLKDGLNPDGNFRNVAFSRAHDASVTFVASAKAEGRAAVLGFVGADRLGQMLYIHFG